MLLNSYNVEIFEYGPKLQVRPVMMIKYIIIIRGDRSVEGDGHGDRSARVR